MNTEQQSRLFAKGFEAGHKSGYKKGYEAGYKCGRLEESKKNFDEFYCKILNEDERSIIEWVQDNLIDDVDALKEGKA